MAEGEEPITNIRGEKAALGPLEKKLLPEYQHWINDFATTRSLDMPPRPMTAEQEERWYETNASSDSSITFTIYALPELLPVGSTGLHNIDYRNRSASFGIIIGETEYRSRGIGTETATLMLDYAFTALGLHNVTLSVYEFNRAGLKAYEKAGFEEIGRRRQCRTMGGKVWDEIYMDALSTDFESPVLGEILVPDEPR